MHVEHAAALGVGERPHAVLRREARERSGGLAAPAEDDERDPARQRHEQAGALTIGRADEPDRPAGQPGALERGPEHVVHECGDRAERGTSRAQDGGVEALQELSGNVERDVRPRLEVRADRADRDPPLAHAQPVRKRPGAGLALERLDPGHRLELAREALDPGVVETQPVERPVVDASPRGVAVLAVHAEQEVPPLEHQGSCGTQRLGHEVVTQRGGGRVGVSGLALDLLVQAHFTLYTDHR